MKDEIDRNIVSDKPGRYVLEFIHTLKGGGSRKIERAWTDLITVSQSEFDAKMTEGLILAALPPSDSN